MIYPLPTLYKRDTSGNIREWTVEYSGPVNPGIRTVSGIKGGRYSPDKYDITFLLPNDQSLLRVLKQSLDYTGF